MCPSGGTYSIVTSGTINDANGVAQTIPTGSLGIKCNVAVHQGFIPGVMGK